METFSNFKLSTFFVISYKRRKEEGMMMKTVIIFISNLTQVDQLCTFGRETQIFMNLISVRNEM